MKKFSDPNQVVFTHSTSDDFSGSGLIVACPWKRNNLTLGLWDAAWHTTLELSLRHCLALELDPVHSRHSFLDGDDVPDGVPSGGRLTGQVLRAVRCS